MATPAQPVARPPAGEVVTDRILAASQASTLSLGRGFAGTSNPTTIWSAMVRDSQSAFAYYRELVMKDDDVGGAVEEMKLSVMSRGSQLVAADKSSDADEVRDFVQAQLDAIDFDQVCDSLLDAPFMGVAIAEKIYDAAASEVTLQDVRDCPQELFSFGPLSEPQIGLLRFMKNGVDLGGGDLVPEDKFVVWSHKPRARNRRGGDILLRDVFWPSWFKRQITLFWLRFAEKGSGTVAVKYKSGASDSEQQQALSLAESILSKIAIAVPDNVGIVEELLQGAKSQNPAVFAQLFQRMQYSIARRIKGETLTSFGNEGGQGSRSQGDTHADTKEERSVAMCRMLERVINLQIVQPLVLYNFGPDAPMPKWTVEKDRATDLSARSLIDQRVQGMGAKISGKYVKETYGLPEPESEDDVLQPLAVWGSPTAALDAATGGPALNQPPRTFSEALDRELKDLDRLMAKAAEGAQVLMRDRIANILSEVRRG